MSNKLFSAVLLLTLNSCGNQQKQTSKLDGHYENSSAELMSPYANTQVAAAEYEPVGKVVLSLPIIINYGREDLIAEILKSNVDEVVIHVPQSFNETTGGNTFAKLRNMVGADISKVKLVKAKNIDGTVSVWARDWSPQGAFNANNELVLLDFNYYARRQTDDFSTQILSQTYGYNRVSIPVYNEGGNFMNNEDGHCMMTTRVTDANKIAELPGDMILNAAQIKQYYKTYAGCKEVTIFPRMPNEGTGHIDMWAKFLDNKTILVNELRPQTLNLITDNNQKQIAIKIRDFLEARAAEIKAMGYTMIRVPMPAPEVLSGSTVIRSYSNALTTNGRAILTQYKTLAGIRQYTDASLLSSYEAEVEAAYQNAGYQTAYINSDQLIANGGAVHCVTMQLPKR
ncbi:agmatine deiminase family protein [Dolichospermum sp. ST_sed1]|nr:agmatine deiminase family protein [Dolichospermum sp. ST_sed1]